MSDRVEKARAKLVDVYVRSVREGAVIHLREQIDELIAAVEEREREACAKVADERLEHHRKRYVRLDPDSEDGLVSGVMCDMAENIAKAIRARGAG